MVKRPISAEYLLIQIAYYPGSFPLTGMQKERAYQLNIHSEKAFSRHQVAQMELENSSSHFVGPLLVGYAPRNSS